MILKRRVKSWKGLHLLYKVPINWTEQDVPIDPYYLGMWAGDGDSNGVAITTMDKEVVGFLYGYAESLGMHVSVYDRDKSKANKYRITNGQGKNNPILNLLRENNLINNKHIPEIYKINSREVRLQVLAGLVDSDGHINRNSVEIIQKSKNIIRGYSILGKVFRISCKSSKCKKGIKSTGFVGEYYRMGISGDCSIIPTRIKRRKLRKEVTGRMFLLLVLEA